MKKIAFAKPRLGFGEILSVMSVLRSGNLAQGRKVTELERKFSELHNATQGVAVNSGTSALHLALLAMEIGPGDEVIVPAITFAATANAVAMTGAEPVIADIDPSSYNLSMSSAVDFLSEKTRAVIPVELYGNAVDISEWSEFASNHGLKLVIDSSQSHLASSYGSVPGEYEFVATYSFYPTKNMTTGEGGMALTNNPELARTMRLLRNQGMSETYVYRRPGLNNRMTEIGAAIGLRQLERLKKYTEHRRRIASVYDRHLEGYILTQSKVERGHVYHQYTILVPGKRDLVAKMLEEAGVPTRIFYPQPLHKIKPYFSEKALPVAEHFSENCLSLPIGPHVSLRSASQIAIQVREVLESVK